MATVAVTTAVFWFYVRVCVLMTAPKIFRQCRCWIVTAISRADVIWAVMRTWLKIQNSCGFWRLTTTTIFYSVLSDSSSFFRSISQSNQCSSCWYHWVFDENAKSTRTYGLSSTHHLPALRRCCCCFMHPKFIMFGICGPLSHQKIFSCSLARWCVLEFGVGTFAAAAANMPQIYS